ADPDRTVRHIGGPGAPDPCRYHADEAAAAGRRGGGEDHHQAHLPAGLLHLPGDVRRDSGPRHHSNHPSPEGLRGVRFVRARNAARARELGARGGVSDTWWLRFRGLGGRAALQPGDGRLLLRCRAIPMMGMTFPFDVWFRDGGNRVVASYPSLGPGRRTRWHREARAALELPSGTLASTGTQLGDLIEYGEEISP